MSETAATTFYSPPFSGFSTVHGVVIDFLEGGPLSLQRRLMANGTLRIFEDVQDAIAEYMKTTLEPA